MYEIFQLLSKEKMPSTPCIAFIKTVIQDLTKKEGVKPAIIEFDFDFWTRLIREIEQKQIKVPSEGLFIDEVQILPNDKLAEGSFRHYISRS